MRIESNGVNLHVLELQRYARRNVLTPDQARVRYIEHLLAASCVYAPGGTPALPSLTAMDPAFLRRLQGNDRTKDALAGGGRGVDPALAPVSLENPAGGVRLPTLFSGAETDHELFHRLMQPQKKFILWATDRRTGREIRWLESPRQGFELDADNGPMPLSCDVVGVSGEGHSVGVLYQIRTCLPPCPERSDRFVLAHSWQMTHAHDDDYYLTRVIQGEIVFHPGVVRLNEIRPDLIRNQFIHPIPLGYRRGVPEITASSDGLTIRYTITDTNPTVVFAPGDSGCTQVDVKERCNLITPPLNQVRLR